MFVSSKAYPESLTAQGMFVKQAVPDAVKLLVSTLLQNGNEKMTIKVWWGTFVLLP